MKIAIIGAGIAGSTLAYWLQRSNHEVLLVEASQQLRSGGYVIDFWGLGYDVAEKMGLLGRLRELSYQVREVRSVDRHGRKRGRVPSRGVSPQPGQAEIHATQRATAGSRVGAVSLSACRPSSCM